MNDKGDAFRVKLPAWMQDGLWGRRAAGAGVDAGPCSGRWCVACWARRVQGPEARAAKHLPALIMSPAPYCGDVLLAMVLTAAAAADCCCLRTAPCAAWPAEPARRRRGGGHHVRADGGRGALGLGRPAPAPPRGHAGAGVGPAGRQQEQGVPVGLGGSSAVMMRQQTLHRHARQECWREAEGRGRQGWVCWLVESMCIMGWWL